MNFSLLFLTIVAFSALSQSVPIVDPVEDDAGLPVMRQARQFGSANALAIANAQGGGYGGYPGYYGGYPGGYYPGGGYGSANAMAMASANAMG